MQSATGPRLRHCTLVATADQEKLTMIVGKEHFELATEGGQRESFLKFKRYLDGRNAMPDISSRSGVALASVEAIVAQFSELGLLRTETPTAAIPVPDFVARIDQSTLMWRRQIGYHRLFGMLERGEGSKDLIVGLLLETYNFVRLASKHISVAIAHCGDAYVANILSAYLADEYRHCKLIADSIVAAGIPAAQIENAHPVIGTLSLVNMLCEIGRSSTLGYLCCLT